MVKDQGMSASLLAAAMELRVVSCVAEYANESTKCTARSAAGLMSARYSYELKQKTYHHHRARKVLIMNLGSFSLIAC